MERDQKMVRARGNLASSSCQSTSSLTLPLIKIFFPHGHHLICFPASLCRVCRGVCASYINSPATSFSSSIGPYTGRRGIFLASIIILSSLWRRRKTSIFKIIYWPVQGKTFGGRCRNLHGNQIKDEELYHIIENKTWMDGKPPHQLLTLLNLQTPLSMPTMLKQRWDTKDYYA